MSTLVPCKIYR